VWWLVPVIPATWEMEIRRISIAGRSRQKVSKTPVSTNKLVWWYTSVILATWEA
jgi:hypothetical protein